jgi:WD40 repeat protein
MKPNLPQMMLVVSIAFLSLNTATFAFPIQEYVKQSTDNPVYVQEVAWSPDGTSIAIGSATNYCEPDSPDLYAIYILYAATLEVIQTLEGHECDITSIEWSPDGTRLVGSSFLGVKVWDVGSGEVLSTLTGWICWSESSWSPDGTKIATVLCEDFRFEVWDAATGNTIRMFDNPQFIAMHDVDWHSDGNRIASSSGDDENMVRIWKVDGSLLMELSGHSDSVTSVAWSPDGVQLASASIDGEVRIWDGETGQWLNTIQGPPPLRHIVWNPSGTAIAGAVDNAETTINYSDYTEGDNTLRIWDTTTGEELGLIESVVGTVNDIDWSPDGTKLVYVGDDTGVHGENLQIVPAPEALIPTPLD